MVKPLRAVVFLLLVTDIFEGDWTLLFCFIFKTKSLLLFFRFLTSCPPVACLYTATASQSKAARVSGESQQFNILITYNIIRFLYIVAIEAMVI